MRKFKNKICLSLAALIAVFFVPFAAHADEFGIDVSNNDDYIRWADTKKVTNIAIIKATEGIDFQDSRLNENYIGAINNGLNVGFYHFFSEKTSPSQQAHDFWNAIKNKKYTIIPTLDIETNNWGRSSTEVSNRALEFLNTFKSISNQDCMIYSGGYFAKDILDFRLKSYKLWEAHYNGQANMNCMYTGFTNLVGHQYSETGRVSGISTYCDLNIFTNGIFLSSNSTIPYKSPIVNNGNCIGKVAQLQQLLNSYGYNLDVDNLWGPKTDAALKNSKLIAGLPYRTPSLTTWIQLRLGCNPDGIFGQATAEAVRDWQARHGLVVDGIAGYNTIKSLALA